MSYLQLLLFVTTAGVCGYLIKSVEKEPIPEMHTLIDTNTVKSQILKLFTDITRGISKFLHDSVTSNFRSNFLDNNLAQSFNPKQITAIGLINRFDHLDQETRNFYGDPVPVIPVATTSNLLDGDIVSNAHITPHPNIPTRSILWYVDYSIQCDSQTRTKWWTKQVITGANVKQTEHRHCESLTLDYTRPRISALDLLDSNQRLNVDYLNPPGHHIVDNQIICHHCQYSNFWKVFQQYLIFLTEKYNGISVMSGFLYQPDWDDDEDDEKCATHFFKVILCRNEDETYRLECYKIKREPMQEQLPKLENYLVEKDLLEAYTGLMIFEEIPQALIRDEEPHPDFNQQIQPQ